jgi:hypothetical protein
VGTREGEEEKEKRGNGKEELEYTIRKGRILKNGTTGKEEIKPEEKGEKKEMKNMKRLRKREEQEVLGGTNRLLSFVTTQTA